MKRKGAWSCFVARRGCARYLEHDLRVQKKGTVVLGNAGWPCQISGSKLKRRILARCAKWHEVAVPNSDSYFWPFVEF